MLPQDKIDAIIVHELCHIIHPNHSKDFYNLVRKYIPNYDEINNGLRKMGETFYFNINILKSLLYLHSKRNVKVM